MQLLPHACLVDRKHVLVCEVAPSVSTVPTIIGMLAETSGASGSKGSRANDRPSTTGPNRYIACRRSFGPPLSAAVKIASGGSSCNLSRLPALTSSFLRIVSVTFCASSIEICIERRTALHHCSMKEAFCRGHRQERAGFSAPRQTGRRSSHCQDHHRSS